MSVMYLSRDRALLEMVRNAFMNLQGYMLVFTGTPDLLPVMDEVFSQLFVIFKKIHVEPFAKIEDTLSGIMKPLEEIGLKEISGLEIFNDISLETDREIFSLFANKNYLQDLHDLTGGRPYEIQLVAHFMFRQIQEHKANRMNLTMEVLEDVLEELEQSQQDGSRPIPNMLKNLDEEKLRDLDLICKASSQTHIQGVKNFSLIFQATRKNSFEDSFTFFEKQNVIKRDNESFSFRGDDLDRILCKYEAKKRGHNYSFAYFPIHLLYTQELIKRTSAWKKRIFIDKELSQIFKRDWKIA